MLQPTLTGLPVPYSYTRLFPICPNSSAYPPHINYCYTTKYIHLHMHAMPGFNLCATLGITSTIIGNSKKQTKRCKARQRVPAEGVEKKFITHSSATRPYGPPTASAFATKTNSITDLFSYIFFGIFSSSCPSWACRAAVACSTSYFSFFIRLCV